MPSNIVSNKTNKIIFFKVDLFYFYFYFIVFTFIWPPWQSRSHLGPLLTPWASSAWGLAFPPQLMAIAIDYEFHNHQCPSKVWILTPNNSRNQWWLRNGVMRNLWMFSFNINKQKKTRRETKQADSHKMVFSKYTLCDQKKRT